MMHSKAQIYLSFLLFVALGVRAELYVEKQNATVEHACRLLDDKFAISNPWTVYPIVYEPINRGRLTIWTGISTLPTSEFKCYGNPKQTLDSKNGNSDIILNFASFANELGWTFYDLNKGVTYHGVSVQYNEKVKYIVSLRNKQIDNYLECNTIDSIKQLPAEDKLPFTIQTACPECTQSQISLINGQLKEVIKSKLDEQIMDNLYWQLSQLVINQHFSGSISLVDSNSH